MSLCESCNCLTFIFDESIWLNTGKMASQKNKTKKVLPLFHKTKQTKINTLNYVRMAIFWSIEYMKLLLKNNSQKTYVLS